jgi:hypothetical protein
MRVEFGLFQGDTLLERGTFVVSRAQECTHFRSFAAAHFVETDSARIVLSNFASGMGLKTVNLDMPLHVSDDWETIDLAGYSLAFRCSLDA